MGHEIAIEFLEHVLRHVVAVHEKFGTDGIEIRGRGDQRHRFLDHAVDMNACFHNGKTFGEAEDGRGLVLHRIRIAQKPDDETIAERTRLTEELDMAQVEEVAHRVGIDPAFRFVHVDFPPSDAPLWRRVRHKAIAR